MNKQKLKKPIILMLIGLYTYLLWRYIQAYYWDAMGLRMFVDLISGLCTTSAVAIFFYSLSVPGKMEVNKKGLIKTIIIAFIVTMLFITVNDLIPTPMADGAGNIYLIENSSIIDILKERQ